jgi:hypothetical protein
VVVAGLALTLGLAIGAPLLHSTGPSLSGRLSVAAHRFLEQHEL